MKIYKRKIKRIINFIKNEGKFERGDMVKIISVKDNPGYDNFYEKYVGQYGIVTGIDYAKKNYIIEVKFEDKNKIDFKIKELEKIQPENPIRYKKMNIEY